MNALPIRQPKRRIYFVYQYWMPLPYLIHFALTGRHPPALPVPVRGPDRTRGQA